MYTVREPKAAGIFYNSDRNSLEREIDISFNGRDGPKEMSSLKTVGMIMPHEKYHLCGPVYAWGASRVAKSNYIIIGSNHFDVGSRFAIMKEGLWKTPLGEIVVSNRMAQKIVDKSKIVDYDVMPHENEHSVEVQLPFLQYRFGNDFKMVPIVIRNRFDDKDFVNYCKELGKAIGQAVKSEKEKWVVIGTTNLSAGPKSQVEKNDKAIIKSLRNLSENSFFKTVHDRSSYLSGYGAVLTTLAAAKEIGAKRSKLLKYGNSLEIVQDPKSVLGYASIIIQ